MDFYLYYTETMISILPTPGAFKNQMDLFLKNSARVKLSSLYSGDEIKKGILIVDGQRSKRSPSAFPNTKYYVRQQGWINSRFIPSPLNELGELYHCKLYVFDKHVILTGANLGKEYYTNRKDRYYVIKNHHFADMMDELLSFMLQTNAFQSNPDEERKLDISGVKQIQRWSNFQCRKIENTFRHMPKGTHILPILNWPRLGIKFDILRFLRTFYPDNLFTLSTAYFNPGAELTDMISRNATVIAPSIDTHGFHNGKGLKKYIPLLYQDMVNKNDIKTWSKEGSSYHAKGIWIEDKEHIVTVIGSNNYGSRSSKDVELDFIILTDDMMVKNEIKNEIDGILKNCKNRDVVKLPFWISLVSKATSRIL
eukprot:NODE_33_length_32023_cov_0.217579.p8 type:complete len:367 gc:universal NODE_33_length_32023_cov_0.217579:26501-27601(+)